MLRLEKEDILAIIDHTELSPDATETTIDVASRTTINYNCASICVRPEWVSRVKMNLIRHDIPITTVISFPEGTNSIEEKIRETQQSVRDGAEEIDLVLDRRNIHARNAEGIREELRAIRSAAPDALIKIIIETAALTDEEIVYVTEIIVEEGNIEYVKTSTGYHPAGGATIHAVELIRKTAPRIGIKASGGIRSLDTAREFVEAGATRIGSSNTANF